MKKKIELLEKLLLKAEGVALEIQRDTTIEEDWHHSKAIVGHLREAQEKLREISK